MLFSYHEPQHFGWNLNAFLQALRSVTLMLQAELAHHEGFQEWYSKEQELMRGDDLLKRFLDGRNFVVHQGMLRRRSHVQAGFFRGRTCKLALGFPLDVDIPTREVDVVPAAGHQRDVDGLAVRIGEVFHLPADGGKGRRHLTV